MIRLRCITDIRQTPLLVGAIQILWGMIPAFSQSGFLFRAMLDDLGIGNDWGWLMILTGLYLMAGAIINRRETLTIGLFLSATVWTSMTIVYFNSWYIESSWYGTIPNWVTPITLSMPLFSLSLWFCCLRELYLMPRFVPERQKQPER